MKIPMGFHSLSHILPRELIPANCSHIPTPSMAERCPHLDNIAERLLPLKDFDVGLLIGYNCPTAHVPREVIPHVGMNLTWTVLILDGALLKQ